jgi:SIT4-associating protein SAP185/190
MLKGGNPLTVGVGIVIEVIRKNNSDYDPDVGAEANSAPSSRDPIYLGTLLRMFGQRVPDFMDLILSPNHTIGGGDGPVTIERKQLNAAFGGKIEPLGFDRFKTCELMAELLHCSNMGLLNEPGSEEFVKARDAEREKLKAEGKLRLLMFPESEDDLTMKSSTQTRLGSPESSRKLEVQNASDDDGFEEVTHSADLGDDAKDDFDEKVEGEDLLGSTSSGIPLSFTDHDDLVDEPLSSPRIHTEAEKHAEKSSNEDSKAEPQEKQESSGVNEALSPASALAQDVENIEIQPERSEKTEEDTPMIDSHQGDSDSSTTASNKHTPESSEESAEGQPIAEKDSTVNIEDNSSVPSSQESMHTMTHSEDIPAPLFAKKNASETTIAGEVASDTETALPQSNSNVESADTTMGEAGDSSNSILMGNTDEHLQHSLSETPSAPVVGDFLKMQFVEHKVVPTILVS